MYAAAASSCSKYFLFFFSFFAAQRTTAHFLWWNFFVVWFSFNHYFVEFPHWSRREANLRLESRDVVSTRARSLPQKGFLCQPIFSLHLISKIRPVSLQKNYYHSSFLSFLSVYRTAFIHSWSRHWRFISSIMLSFLFGACSFCRFYGNINWYSIKIIKIC